MKLIRWLLSNILLIVAVLALCYAYVYWDNLTGEDTPAGKAVAWVSEEFEAVEGLLSYLKVTGNSELNQPAESATNKQAVALTQEAAEPAPMQMPEPVAEQPAVLEPTSTGRYVTPEIEQSLSRVSEDGTGAIVSEEQPQTTRELWIDARKSFHRRDFEKSIASYEQLISKNPDNFDAYGEMGNVYFNQGDMKQAASSYYEAAAILVRLGQVERASSLMGMLGRMDPDKAKELQELISPASS